MSGHHDARFGAFQELASIAVDANLAEHLAPQDTGDELGDLLGQVREHRRILYCLPGEKPSLDEMVLEMVPTSRLVQLHRLAGLDDKLPELGFMGPPAAPPPPTLLRVTLHLTPEEYDLLEQAMLESPMLVTGKDDDGQLSLLPDEPASSHGEKRTALPLPALRAVFARASHRCERCGCKHGPFQIHHIRPWSRGVPPRGSDRKK